MAPIRPEILAFAKAAASIIKRATSGDRLSDEEAGELGCCMGKIEEMLRRDSERKALP